MKAFFDTSVLVPVFYGDHVHHEASFQRFIQCDPSTGFCGAHSLAEVYSTLTRMPGRHRISGEQAMLFINNICERLSLVALDGKEYAEALRAAASLSIVGEGIYDALLAHCASSEPNARSDKAGEIVQPSPWNDAPQAQLHT